MAQALKTVTMSTWELAANLWACVHGLCPVKCSYVLQFMEGKATPPRREENGIKVNDFVASVVGPDILWRDGQWSYPDWYWEKHGKRGVMVKMVLEIIRDPVMGSGIALFCVPALVYPLLGFKDMFATWRIFLSVFLYYFIIAVVSLIPLVVIPTVRTFQTVHYRKWLQMKEGETLEV